MRKDYPVRNEFHTTRKNGILDSVFRLQPNVQDKSSENAELTPGRISKKTNR